MKYLAGTHMLQDDYEELAECSFVEQFTPEQAQLFIAKNFGFDALKVKIINQAATYKHEERNGAKCIAPDKKYERIGLYASTDWNYVRFDVCNWSYECVNGELYFYES